MALRMWGQVIIQAATPAEDPVVVGSVWIDTTSGAIPKVCTAVSPYTWVNMTSVSAPGAHASSHQDGGADEISVTGLAGLLADPQTPLGHHTRHEDNGNDEISVAGLSGKLADAQTALPHVLLDGSIHSDTLAGTVARGDIIFGNSTPKWARKAVGTGVLVADGTDVTGWTQTPTFTTPVVSTSLNLTGGQITFPATQSASSGANVLDDYEEGNWTPTIGGAGGESSQTYSSQIGTYLKIGRVVIAFGYVQLSAKGTITGQVQIEGLPFTSSNSVAVTLRVTGLNVTAVYTGGFVANGTINMPIELKTAAAASPTGMVQNDLTNTSDFMVTAFYNV